jgi:protein CLEC16A
VSILLINASRSATLFFLLSNGHVNDLIESPLDEADEELVGYYVSLLKTLSLALGTGAADTLQFFFLAAPGLS